MQKIQKQKMLWILILVGILTVILDVIHQDIVPDVRNKASTDRSAH
jgi:hypothetical protein